MDDRMDSTSRKDPHITCISESHRCDTLQHPNKIRYIHGRTLVIVIGGVLSFVIVLGLIVLLMATVSSRNESMDLVLHEDNTGMEKPIWKPKLHLRALRLHKIIVTSHF